ncbi:MAG TPA: hypothetical protein VF234_04075, partial [Limnochordia bacterium]
MSGPILWGALASVAVIAVLLWPLRIRCECEGRIGGGEGRAQGRVRTTFVLWGPLAFSVQLALPSAEPEASGAAAEPPAEARGDRKAGPAARRGRPRKTRAPQSRQGLLRAAWNIEAAIEAIEGLFGEPWRKGSGETVRSPVAALLAGVIALPALAVGRGIRRCEALTLRTAVGCGDAGSTGLAVGM